MGLLCALLLSQDSPYLVRDLERVEAEYLAVAPPALAGRLDPLLAHRAKTWKVALVRTDDVAARHGKGAEGIRKLVEAAKPLFLLLAGDVDAVPTFVRNSEYVSEKFLSDPDLATDHLFGAVTGRLPADTPEELAAMIAKTVEYETSLAAGRWQHRAEFIAGEGGFGAAIDALLERQFTAIVTSGIPASCEVEIAYAKGSSRYGIHPPAFNEHALRRLNGGPLFYTYVGHGQRTGFDHVRFEDDSYPILESKDVRRVESGGGFPIMIVIACNTGEYDHAPGDCIGEELMKRPRGPVAFIGGTRATQPYGNALLGQKLVAAAFDPEAATVGEVLWSAKAAVLAKDDSALRKQADVVAGLIQGPSSLEKMRKDVVLHYNLLGDPALVVRRPSESIAVEAPRKAAPGSRIRVRGRCDEDRVEVRLECPRDRFLPAAEIRDDDPARRMARQHAQSNDKAAAKAEVATREGGFEVELLIPEGLPPGPYLLKVYAPGNYACRPLDLAQ